MSHHAYLYSAATLEAADLPSGLVNDRVEVEQLQFDRLGVGEARELARLASLKSVSDASRTLVIYTPLVTIEAQNALLKLFEDPPPGVIFHFITPRPENLLPTLRSRFFEITKRSNSSQANAFQSFCSADYASRLALVAEHQKSKDIVWQQEIYEGLVGTLAQLENKLSIDRQTANLFISYFPRRGASKKMLLELLALALPAS